jgi:aerobic carbon-monoxide dehydrogenase medium subunit
LHDIRSPSVKPGRFDYEAPENLDEALALLSEHGDSAKVLAGGQSLVPAMNFRLAQPAVIVDINRVAGLGTLAARDDRMSIGALVRHRDLERPPTDDPAGRLFEKIARYVGHYPIRVRGTFAGSLAHADPAAEWCMLAVALDAVVVATSARETRSIAAAEFFDSPFTTALKPEEMIVAVEVPYLGTGTGVGFEEHSHTAGDFATVAAMATIRVTDGHIAEARVALAGVEGVPVRGRAAEEELVGAAADADGADRAARALAAVVEPGDDLHASSDYRRHLARILTERAIVEALRDAA